jgi:subtilisin family serine protease
MIESQDTGTSTIAVGPTVAAGGLLAAPTGRYVVVFDSAAEPFPVLASAAGLTGAVDSREFEDPDLDFSGAQAADALVFSNLNVAVTSMDPDQFSALRASDEARGAIVSISYEQEYKIQDGAERNYAQGYLDGVTDLSGRLGTTTQPTGSQQITATPAFADTAQFTWGLLATEVSSSPLTGSGIRVAVLDTGFDSTHPDFVGRIITTNSFVAGESSQDGHGHGTHCIGTACGSKTPAAGPRYGIAHEAEIYAGKVLSNSGSGTDAGIIAGISWAVANGCHVISMSLGADIAAVHPPYTVIGRRALDAGSLIVAAAGNNANRPVGNFGFVGAPANSPYILAVGALTQELDLAFFSARTLKAIRGGQVDLAAPGYQVRSSWIMPTQYRTISGTSMATPHVAGIAALWAQATGFRGRELWASLAQESQRILQLSADVGGGLALAPR